MAELLRQEMAQREKDIAAGLLLPGIEMCERFGMPPDELDAALEANRMFALAGPSGEHYFPASHPSNMVQ